MNKEKIALIMAEKVEKIIKKNNAETKGVDNKTSKRSMVNEILVELDKVVKDEN